MTSWLVLYWRTIATAYWNLNFVEKDLCIHSILVIREQLLSIVYSLKFTGPFLLFEVFKK